tara:strand:+ start:188 stop:655 length:468 start_codon:yes stop_codon:yes gene_type:complete
MVCNNKLVDNFTDYLIYSNGDVFGKKRGKFLKHYITVKGYSTVLLYRKGYKKKHFKIHRLVANAFIENTYDKPCIDHIDRNKANNDISNLRWVTVKENNNNKGQYKSNTSGHQHISYCGTRNRWIYVKVGNKRKTFKTKQEAIIWKFCELIKNKI